MTLGELDEYINRKINENENIIIFTFYELRIKCNLSKQDTEKFLELAKNKLEQNNYKTYLPGEMYIFNNRNNTVKENQLLIAVK